MTSTGLVAVERRAAVGVSVEVNVGTLNLFSETQASQVSISPAFYEQLFRKKVFCAAFMCLQFGLVIFWRKDFGAKAAYKMLVKLMPGVDFTNIL